MIFCTIQYCWVWISVTVQGNKWISEMMTFYISDDWRVSPLIMIVKKWAKRHGINDASQGTLSSYSIAMMVLHYLQGKLEKLQDLINKVRFPPWPGIFFKLARCGYTLRVTSQASYSPEYITPTQKKNSSFIMFVFLIYSCRTVSATCCS
jgi:hypothetical protein